MALAATAAMAAMLELAVMAALGLLVMICLRLAVMVAMGDLQELQVSVGSEGLEGPAVHPETLVVQLMAVMVATVGMQKHPITPPMLLVAWVVWAEMD